MKNITIQAHAKINLGLSVLGERDDGYHDLCTIMQSISLYDRLTIERTDTPVITLLCSEASLPVDERNLCYKAAKVLLGKKGV